MLKLFLCFSFEFGEVHETAPDLGWSCTFHVLCFWFLCAFRLSLSSSSSVRRVSSNGQVLASARSGWVWAVVASASAAAAELLMG